MSLLYLTALLGSAAGMAALDLRFRLVLAAGGRRARSALIALGLGVAFFLLWDLAAIASGHYRTGESAAMTGIHLAPELPLEELVFVSFLAYLTLVLRALIARGLDVAAVRRRDEAVRRGAAISAERDEATGDRDGAEA